MGAVVYSVGVHLPFPFRVWDGLVLWGALLLGAHLLGVPGILLGIVLALWYVKYKAQSWKTR